MATLPPNSLLARSRQTRSAAASITNPLATAPALPVASSNVNLFLTNLRLLDFPSYPDWPDFDSQTFSVQKKRIHCVEWTLYQLFVLWDPEEARNKLQPFFPPRDHVQSLNLRAALLRSLEQAKKNGVLGRDAVVRKTMLDECKGERLEEVLAVFSSAVLKKMVADVAEAEREYPAVAQQLALENRGYSAERTELVTLALAHKVSIANAMRRKDRARKQYKDLAELLNSKDRSIVQRKQQITAAREQSKGYDVSDDLKLDTWRMVRNNWAGNEQWMETLLYGDANARKDGLLTAPFDRVWRRMQSGRLPELEDEGKGLLEQLDGRVKTQKERLDKWQDFRRNMFGDKPSATSTTTAQKRKPAQGIDLGFDLHDNLHLGSMSSRKQLAKKSPSLTSDYADIMDGLQSELAQVGAAPVVSLDDLLGPPGPRTRQPERPGVSGTRESLGEETISELSELEDDGHVPHNPPRRPSFQDTLPQPQSRRLERPLIKLPHGIAQPTELPRPLPSPVLPPDTQGELPIPPPTPPLPEEDDVAERIPDRSPSPPRRFGKEAAASLDSDEDLFEPQPPKSPTQELADKILDDINNASPSPVKRSKPRHTLSLAERTRLSMARSSRGVRYDPDDDDEDDTLSLRPRPQLPSEEVTINVTDEDDLVSRTRRSMVGFEAARQKAQLDRQRSVKKSRARARTEGSQYPVVEEETAQFDPDASLADELMAVEDMEAVFRSRPRIKTSPAPSPSRRPLEAEDV
ncbi:hypothetical protein CMUS01_07939 [Colletotrichum musicola]|uniref:HAUS augmin-like complex subunit 6 N-terminal domain-containing protein n=1 Tax=Colletotrichum musicola TaxID=2175873 RepID=A0A8H6KF99_9PEZI|nr:hypothetical protein CMUS01_07939 [Colletotrichum musicola]